MHRTPIALVLFLLLTAGAVSAQDTAPGFQVTSLQPQYLPVMDLLRLIGANPDGTIHALEWTDGESRHRVEVRVHETANRLILSGTPADLERVRGLAAAVDLPPRQIEIVARIVEMDRNKAYDLGIDWDELWRTSGTRGQATYFEDNTDLENNGFSQDRSTIARQLQASTSVALYNAVHLLEESGAGSVRNTPRIMTLNNRAATILDGQRVTYVTRLSSYSNIYETETLDAGLKLEVTPSLGESGYLTLHIVAELTGLGSNISGSPVKDGQIIENTVIVKAGETILLGGFERHIEQRSRKRFPVLGHILPFIFSREVKVDQALESFIVLTANVVDLDPALDPRRLEMLEGSGAGGR